MNEWTSSAESSPLNEKSQANLGIVFLSRELVIVTSLTGNKGTACRASNLAEFCTLNSTQRNELRKINLRFLVSSATTSLSGFDLGGWDL